MEVQAAQSTACLGFVVGKEEKTTPEYHEMVRRIPKEDMELIEAKMASLENIETKLDEIHSQLDRGDYHSLDQDAFYYALRGLKEGKTSAAVVGRISDIETLRLQGIEFQVIDLFDLKKECPEPAWFLNKLTGKQLNQAQLNQFYREMRQLPPRDRMVMVFTPKRGNIKIFEPGATVSQGVDTKQKMKVFSRVGIPGGDNGEKVCQRFFASLELFDLVLKVKFGEEKTHPNPVLGISSIEDIERNGQTDTRDVCHLYLVPRGDSNELIQYAEADGLPCEENDFNYHDRYHLFVTSSVGREERRLSIDIAMQLKKHAIARRNALDPSDYQAMRSTRWQLVDMDFPNHYNFERNYNRRKDREGSYSVIQANPRMPFFFDVFEMAVSQCNNMAMKEVIGVGTNPKVFATMEALDETFNFILERLPKSEDFSRGGRAVGKVFVPRKEEQRALHEIAASSPHPVNQLKARAADHLIASKALDALQNL